MRLISFTYRDGRVASNEATGTLDGTGTPDTLDGMDSNESTSTLANNLEAGTGIPGTHSIKDLYVALCRMFAQTTQVASDTPCIRFICQRTWPEHGQNTPPFTHVSDRRGFPLLKGRPQKQLVPTGKTKGEKND